STAARGWRTTSARARSTSTPTCRAARPARCSAARSATATGKPSAARSEGSMRPGLTLVLALAALAGASHAATPPVEKWTLVQCGSALAVPGQAPRGETTVVVHDGQIGEVLNGFPAVDQVMSGKSGASEVVDLRDKFCLPGLVDLHVHL